MTTKPSIPQTEQIAAWFGFLGGGLAWIIHLVALSVIAEFGYFAGMEQYTYLGVTSIAWLVIGASMLMTAVAAFATATAIRAQRAVDSYPDAASGNVYNFIARSGIYLSATFLFIIVAESIPVFFFLTFA